MRRLWQDIDHSRDKLGLGGEARANGAAWTWDAWLAWATGVVGEAGGRVSALPGRIGTTLGQLPGAGVCQAVGEGAYAVLRKLPVVGTMVSLVPGPSRGDRSDEAD